MLWCWSVLVLVEVVVFVGSVKLESETLRKSVTYLIYTCAQPCKPRCILLSHAYTLESSGGHLKSDTTRRSTRSFPHSYGRRIVTTAEAGLMLSNDTTKPTARHYCSSSTTTAGIFFEPFRFRFTSFTPVVMALTTKERLCLLSRRNMEGKDTENTIIIRNQASRAGQSAIVP